MKVHHVIAGLVNSPNYNLETIHIINLKHRCVMYGGKLDPFLNPSCETDANLTKSVMDMSVIDYMVQNDTNLYILTDDEWEYYK